MRRILLSRIDRIGDLVLSLPVESAWQKAEPADEIYWLIDEKLKFIMSGHPRVLTVNAATGFWELVGKIKSYKFDLSVCFHVPWWVTVAIFVAGIKERVGVASQWYSWIFFNKKLRQKRSQALKNEAQYNLDLASHALGKNLTQLEAYQIKADQNLKIKWESELGRDFVVIHAGMAGSARNWPAENYKNAATALLKEGRKIIATGSAIDEEFIKATGILTLPGVVNLVNKTPPADLLAVLSLAKAVIVPSTGVAHLSASLGVKVLGIYSPVKVQAPLRWGPLGKNVQVFVPDVDCPGKMACLGEACAKFDCMKTIGVEVITRNI